MSPEAQHRPPAVPEKWTAEEAAAILQRMAQAVPAAGVGQVADPRPAEGMPHAEARYRTLVEQIPAVTFMAALDGGVSELYVSPQIESLLGFTQEEWLGNPFLWYAQLHPDDRERWHDEFARTCATGVRFRSDYRFLARDGRVVWVHGECQVVRDAEGRPLFLQGIAYDISENKRAEEALQRAHEELEQRVQERTVALARTNAVLEGEIARRRRLEEELRQRAEQLTEEGRRKDEFLAILGHELRNPLAPVRNVVYILSQPGVTPAMAEWSRSVLERQVAHMARLIDDLLDVSRINRDRIELRRQAVDLAAIVRHTVDLFRPTLDARGHTLDVSLPSEPLPLLADPDRLEQVLTNLLSNAAKYTEPGGRIAVTAARAGGEAVLRVRDNGIGIPADMLERVFEMFTQVDSARDRSTQWGMGIGLTLVRKLVELHGGRVAAFSAGPGMGSEFVVTLPLRESAPRGGGSAGPSRSSALPASHSALGRRVLLADDNRDFVESMALLLRAGGHEVRVAFDGPGALAAAVQFHPEVVFLDIGMPGMDGFQVARRLRQQPAARDVLLVAVTGYGHPEDLSRSHDAGFDYHLTKPVEAEMLQDLLLHPAAPAG